MPFSTFVGNEKVKARVSSLLASGRMPHAVLLEGDAGLGKRTLARLVACALVCRGEGERPCLHCPPCKKALSGGHPDVVEASGGAAARSFHVDTVRRVKADAYILPNEAPYKIYILGNAHTMSEQAQNALLKVLEEPPGYAVFLLTCSSRTELLPTVLSRCTEITLSAPAEPEAERYVRGVLPDAKPEEVARAAQVFAGNIGKMLQSLDGGLQKAVVLCEQAADALLSAREYDLMALSGVFEKDKELLDTVLRMLLLLLRDALALGAGSGASLSGQAGAAARLSQGLTPAALYALYRSVQELQSLRMRNMNHTLLITRFCYALRRAAGR